MDNIDKMLEISKKLDEKYGEELKNTIFKVNLAYIKKETPETISHKLNIPLEDVEMIIEFKSLIGPFVGPIAGGFRVDGLFPKW